MVRIPFLEKVGVPVAAMSERMDGDGAHAEGMTAILRALDLDESRIAFVDQVHGTRIVEGSGGGAGDGIITNEPGLVLVIRIADCVPVYVVDPCHGAIGLFHAGREGTMQEIVRHGLSAMAVSFGTRGEDCRAYLGASAGPCCYEVSEDLARSFGECGWETEGRKLNLWDANFQQLLSEGVEADNIMVSADCTVCGDRYFSYRGGDKRSRNLAILTL